MTCINKTRGGALTFGSATHGCGFGVSCGRIRFLGFRGFLLGGLGVWKIVKGEREGGGLEFLWVLGLPCFFGKRCGVWRVFLIQKVFCKNVMMAERSLLLARLIFLFSARRGNNMGWLSHACSMVVVLFG